MSGFNPNKCYVEKNDSVAVSSNWTSITYYFQIISSFVYTVLIVCLFFILISSWPSSGYRARHRHGATFLVDFFLLYVLGWPNLKIFLNSFFAPKIKLDFVNGLISVKNKPLSFERIQKVRILEIRPYHDSWRFGEYSAFNLSGYKKSIVTITTSYGDINFYICSEKAIELITKFCEKFNIESVYTYVERRLFLTFY